MTLKTSSLKSTHNTKTLNKIRQRNYIIIFFSGTTEVDAETTGIGTSIFQLTSMDVEGDNIYFSISCNPSNCPFVLLDCKIFIICTCTYSVNVFLTFKVDGCISSLTPDFICQSIVRGGCSSMCLCDVSLIFKFDFQE